MTLNYEPFVLEDYEDDAAVEWKWAAILQLTLAIKHLESPYHNLPKDEHEECVSEAYERRAELLSLMPLRSVS